MGENLFPRISLEVPSFRLCNNPTCEKKVGIFQVIFNAPATIVIWDDGTKTVVKCQPGDEYSRETGLAMCIAKKYLGNKGNFNEVFKKFIEDYDSRESKKV